MLRLSRAIFWFETPAHKLSSHPKTKKHATPGNSRNCVQILGAVNQIRTGDLFLTKEVLYQLSYNSFFLFRRFGRLNVYYYSTKYASCQRFFPILKKIKFQQLHLKIKPEQSPKQYLSHMINVRKKTEKSFKPCGRPAEKCVPPGRTSAFMT